MNGIHLDINKITNTNPKENLFELRKKIYNELLDQIYKHIDSLYERLVSDQKEEEINNRSIKSAFNKESLTILYKGIEIPLMDKTCIVLDNIEYIPIFQLVDRSVHQQKLGTYMVVKNNIRNTFLKLDGHKCDILCKNGRIPLLPYLLYLYDDVKSLLIDLGYTIKDINEIDEENDDYYIVPEYYTNSFLIVAKDFEPKGWKEYFLSPYTKEEFEFHSSICNKIIDLVNNDIIPEVLENGESQFNLFTDIKNTSEIDEMIEENKKRKESVNEKNAREYILLHQERDNQEKVNKIFNIVSMYHINTRSTKRNLTKILLETSLYKYNCKDITMNNLSIFDMLIDHIKNNVIIPDCYNIADISQKDIRFMEWLALKLSSVSSYPEQNIIMETSKTEQKRIYNNSVNPVTELSMMSRVNLFGKGAIPLEACSPHLRNLHDSYMGVIDSVDSSSGRHIGISLHLVPEVFNTDMNIEVQRLHENNIINILYKKQFEKDDKQ